MEDQAKKYTKGSSSAHIANDLTRSISSGLANLRSFEIRFLMLMLAEIDGFELPKETQKNATHQSCAVVRLSIDKVRKHLTESNHFNANIEQAIDALHATKVKFKDPSDPKKTIRTSWLTETTTKGDEFVTLITPGMILAVFQLKQEFTRIDLVSTLNLRSKTYALRLYPLLASHAFENRFETDIDDLRAILGAKETLKNNSDFIKRAVKDSCEAITELTDLAVNFERANRGRVWKKIRFTIIRRKSAPERAQLKKAEKVPEWEIWFQEKLKTDDGQDDLWELGHHFRISSGLRTHDLAADERFETYAPMLFAESKQIKNACVS